MPRSESLSVPSDDCGGAMNAVWSGRSGAATARNGMSVPAASASTAMITTRAGEDTAERYRADARRPLRRRRLGSGERLDGGERLYPCAGNETDTEAAGCAARRELDLFAQVERVQVVEVRA